MEIGLIALLVILVIFPELGCLTLILALAGWLIIK